MAFKVGRGPWGFKPIILTIHYGVFAHDRMVWQLFFFLFTVFMDYFHDSFLLINWMILTSVRFWSSYWTSVGLLGYKMLGFLLYELSLGPFRSRVWALELPECLLLLIITLPSLFYTTTNSSTVNCSCVVVILILIHPPWKNKKNNLTVIFFSWII
jgi:hypothetical protein